MSMPLINEPISSLWAWPPKYDITHFTIAIVCKTRNYEAGKVSGYEHFRS